MNKKLSVVMIVIAGAAVIAAAALLIYSSVSGGSNTPSGAIWGYERAAMLRDADGMIKYSSEYNVAVLSDANPSSESLKSYLSRVYGAAETSEYETELICKVVKETYIEPGTERHAVLMAEYLRRVPDAEDVKEFAFVSLNIYSGSVKILTFNGYAVLDGGKWFYFKPE